LKENCDDSVGSANGVAQVVEQQLSKHEALSSNPSATGGKKKKNTHCVEGGLEKLQVKKTSISWSFP
jgi:hypothetical protein